MGHYCKKIIVIIFLIIKLDSFSWDMYCCAVILAIQNIVFHMSSIQDEINLLKDQIQVIQID